MTKFGKSTVNWSDFALIIYQLLSEAKIPENGLLVPRFLKTSLLVSDAVSEYFLQISSHMVVPFRSLKRATRFLVMS